MKEIESRPSSEHLTTIGEITRNAHLNGESRLLNAQTAEGIELRVDQQKVIDSGGTVIVDTAGNAINYHGVYDLQK